MIFEPSENFAKLIAKALDRILWYIALLGTCGVMIGAAMPPPDVQEPMNTETFIFFALYLLSVLYIVLSYEPPQHLR